MKKLFVILCTTLCCLTATAQSVRQSELLNDGWRFAFGNAADPQKDFGCGTEYFNYLTKANSIHNEGPYTMKFNDAAWQRVRVPHDWVAALPFDSLASHSHGYKTVGWHYPETSVGWYRKVFAIPESDLGKHLQLRFDGIFRSAQVWFNGFYMGTEPSGYATQVYDITPYVNYGGENLICVRADATLEEGWFYEGAGIYRDVWLDKSATVSVAPFGTFVYSTMQEPYTEATVNIETDVTNYSLTPQQCTVSHRMLDADGREVGRSTEGRLTMKAKQTANSKLTIDVTNPHLWSTDTPYLYNIETIVSVDGRVTDVYTTTTGLRHIAFDADRGFLLNGKVVKLRGVNMHQDHAGVGAAIPDALQAWRIRQLKSLGCNAYRASHNPMTPAVLDICDREGMLVIDENRLMGINDEHLRLLQRMIRRDRNHPSIILWSDGNEEWGLENNVQGIRVAEAMREYTRLFDPTRPSTVANAGGGELVKGLDVVGFNYIVQNDVDNRKRNNPQWKIVGTEETSGCGTRGIYFTQPDNSGRMVSLNRTNEQGYENIIERGWKFYDERPWASGLFYWTGFDYRGEPNPLKYPATSSEFGILDYCGFPKDEGYYLKSWWTDEPVLHVFPHWNLSGHEGETVELWAYSNCDEVELTVNGKNLGRQTMPRNGHLKWQATYQPGRVVATGYKNGRRIMTKTIETTGPAAAVTLSADRTTIAADGRDVAVVTIEVRDKKGRVVPDACPELTVTLFGNGRIIGVGNGDPSYHGAENPNQLNCHQFTIPAFNGLAQVIVQSQTTPGSITVTCSADGLSTAKCTLTTDHSPLTSHPSPLKTPVIITAGQSNADGRVPLSELPDSLSTYNYCMWSYGSGDFETADGTFTPYFPRLAKPKTEHSWGFDAVVYHLLEQQWQRPFYVIKHTDGGTAIDPSCSRSTHHLYWSADEAFLGSTASASHGGRSLLKGLCRQIDDCLPNLPRDYDIKFLLWHQGESDCEAPDRYYDNLKAVIAYIRQHIVSVTGQKRYRHLPVVCATFAKNSRMRTQQVVDALERLQGEDPDFHVIDAADLTLLRDRLHFDARGAQTLGQRVFDRLRTIKIMQ